MKLSIIMPSYNEQATIEESINRIIELPVEKELIIVDDGSRDGTKGILQKYKNRENIVILEHPINQGKGMAIRTGIKKARGDYIVIQDADLEYDPKDLLRMLEVAEEKKLKVLYGSRTLGNNKKSYWRYYIGGKFVTAICNILYRSTLTDEPTCYKMFKSEVLMGINLECHGFEFCPEVTAKVLRAGISIEEIPIKYYPRKMAEGKKIRVKDGWIAILTLIKYRILK